jgi:NADH:ubiquinone oxidoreductase subunit H
MFFLAEYSNIILMSALTSVLFFSGWHSKFFSFVISPEIILSLKTIFFCFIFVLIRATVPRFTYFQLMGIAWKYLMPIAFSMFTILIAIVFAVLAI